MRDTPENINMTTYTFQLLEVRPLARLQELFTARRDTASIVVMSSASGKVSMKGKEYRLSAGQVLVVPCPLLIPQPPAITAQDRES